MILSLSLITGDWEKNKNGKESKKVVVLYYKYMQLWWVYSIFIKNKK